MHQLSLTAIPNIPLIKPGDDLGEIIVTAMRKAHLALSDGDILVIAQKIVSKAEGRLRHLSQVQPSPQARRIARLTQKDPRLVQIILDDSNEVLRTRPGLLVVEQRLGFVCANAGMDRSNVAQDDPADEQVALLPLDPDASARAIRQRIARLTGRTVAAIINDSHGRAFRMGITGVAIGVAGLDPLSDRRGQEDLFGYVLQYTVVALADEVAAAASILMGQAHEGQPVILVQGMTYDLVEDASAKALIRKKEQDLFR
ncbi:MAG: coenzyme F420-0:L-glutamate ligase [Deinococcus sp.]|nr:coenzyme F420-0:L-glutamate ligase [Deinococcus sp.]